jgi:hypothetical protein
MKEIIQPPIVVMEGRRPLPDQLITRQTYVPAELEKDGILTFYVDPLNPDTHDSHGRIRAYTAYGQEEPLQTTLEPSTYTWRLRDPVWSNGDPAAYPDSQGYNSTRARSELAMRQGFAIALSEMGLDSYGVHNLTSSDLRAQQVNESIFVKPNRISDVSTKPGTRAQIIHAAESIQLAKDVIAQKILTPIPAQQLAAHLGITTAKVPNAEYLHAIRVFAPLWLPPGSTPAVELRLTDPLRDVGNFFATQQYLLEPGHVFAQLPKLNELHQKVHTAFTARYGEHNYLAFDYLIQPDGTVKVLNGLIRALTPNLEGQAPEVQHLANATADVEIRHLARLALELAG